MSKQVQSSKEFIDVFGAPLVYNKHKHQSTSDLQMIQTKISCLSDCDRLQKIVDIVEEAGEWFNLTPKKFEFDLKRLDKKTLIRIERCLQLWLRQNIINQYIKQTLNANSSIYKGILNGLFLFGVGIASFCVNAITHMAVDFSVFVHMQGRNTVFPFF